MVQLQITGRNFALVLQGVREIDERVLAAGEKALRKGLLYAAGRAQKEGLSGPRPDKLAVVTGRLRGSIATDVQRDGKGLVGRIGSNVAYARWHEFGFTGAVEVKAHNRVIGVVLANGMATRTGANKAAVRKSRQKSLVVGFTQVEAHTRRINYPGRPFIRPALEKEFPLILSELTAELAAASPSTS